MNRLLGGELVSGVWPVRQLRVVGKWGRFSGRHREGGRGSVAGSSVVGDELEAALSDTFCEESDLLEIGHRVRYVLVVGSGVAEPVPACTDGQHMYFDDDATARVAAHLTSRLDLAGRLVSIERAGIGWRERRGWISQPLHHRRVAGHPVFRFDDEWLFTEAEPLPEQRGQQPNRAKALNITAVHSPGRVLR